MERPNILVVMCDQMKATASHLYGNTFCQTPSMQRLAERGVLYNQAITPHPLCVPARISFWTGQFPHAHGGRRNETPMPDGALHAFKLWQEAGYHTGLIGKNHCFEGEEQRNFFDTYCEISHGGLPKNSQTRGMDWFRPLASINAAHAVRRNMPDINPTFSYASSDFPLEDYSTGLVAGQTCRFLEAHKDEPFALWVSIPDPHTPFEAPERYTALFPPHRIDMPPWRADEFAAGNAPERNRVLYQILGLGDAEMGDIKGVMGAYYAMVRFVDDALGQILDALQEQGLDENTIVVFCSDHGDFIGEHHMVNKGGLFYDCLTRVPLIVSWPGRIATDQVDDSMVNLIDVVPTLLQLQGMEVPRSMQGEGLPGVTAAPPRDAAFSEYGAGGPFFGLSDLNALEQPYGRKALMQSLRRREAEGRRKMVRTKRWKYVHDPMGDMDELYDLEQDPWELTNVIGDEGHKAIIAEMKGRLADWSIATEDAFAVPLPDGD